MSLDSPDGQDVNLAAGSEMTLSDVTRPANGSYSYGYILMANTFGIKAKKQFTNTMHTYEVEQVVIIAGQKMPPHILLMR